MTYRFKDRFFSAISYRPSRDSVLLIPCRVIVTILYVILGTLSTAIYFSGNTVEEQSPRWIAIAALILPIGIFHLACMRNSLTILLLLAATVLSPYAWIRLLDANQQSLYEEAMLTQQELSSMHLPSLEDDLATFEAKIETFEEIRVSRTLRFHQFPELKWLQSKQVASSEKKFVDRCFSRLCQDLRGELDSSLANGLARRIEYLQKFMSDSQSRELAQLTMNAIRPLAIGIQDSFGKLALDDVDGYMEATKTRNHLVLLSQKFPGILIEVDRARQSWLDSVEKDITRTIGEVRYDDIESFSKLRERHSRFLRIPNWNAKQISEEEKRWFENTLKKLQQDIPLESLFSAAKLRAVLENTVSVFQSFFADSKIVSNDVYKLPRTLLLDSAEYKASIKSHSDYIFHYIEMIDRIDYEGIDAPLQEYTAVNELIRSFDILRDVKLPFGLESYPFGWRSPLVQHKFHLLLLEHKKLVNQSRIKVTQGDYGDAIESIERMAATIADDMKTIDDPSMFSIHLDVSDQKRRQVILNDAESIRHMAKTIKSIRDSLFFLHSLEVRTSHNNSALH